MLILTGLCSCSLVCFDSCFDSLLRFPVSIFFLLYILAVFLCYYVLIWFSLYTFTLIKLVIG